MPAATDTDRAYVCTTSKTAVIGNGLLERRFEIRRGRLKTTAVVNKLTGRVFRMSSDEFTLAVGKRGTTLTGGDFTLDAVQGKASGRARAQLAVQLCAADASIRVTLTYEVRNGRPTMRKELRVETSDLVRRIGVESFTLRGCRFAFGGFGQPLFVDDELFLGLEYPAGHNAGKRGGSVLLHHYPGRRGPVESKTAVLGVSANTVNHRARDEFLRYIDENRARPVGFMSQLGEVMWRHRAHKVVEAMSCREVFEDARDTFLKRGVEIDGVYFHGDRQWVNPQSVMGELPARQQTPFTLRRRVGWARDILKAPVVMHLNTGGGRSSGDPAWFAQHFDMINSRYYCLADPRVSGQLKENLLALVRKYDFAGFSFDWLWWRKAWECGQKGHRGHIDGRRYSREAITDRFIEIAAALRKEKPEIVLEDLEIELSPWWLFHADALWAYAGEGDKLPFEQIDGAMWHWMKHHVVFPMSSVMYATPEPEVPFGRNHPDEHMLHFVLMHYLRGGQIEELFFKFTKLSEHQKDRVAQIIKWARAREHILLANSTPILGDPFKMRTYGYSHFTEKNEGIIGVRNPAAWRTDKVKLRLDERIHFHAGSKAVAVDVVYPYRQRFRGEFQYSDSLELDVPGDEIVVLEVRPTGRELPRSSRQTALGVGVGQALTHPRGAPGPGAPLLNARPQRVSPMAGPGPTTRHGAIPPPLLPRFTVWGPASGRLSGSCEVDVPRGEKVEMVIGVELHLEASTSLARETRTYARRFALPEAGTGQPGGQIEMDPREPAYHDLTVRFLERAGKALAFEATTNGKPARIREEIFTVPAHRFDSRKRMREIQNPALMSLIKRVGPHPNHKNFVMYPRRYRIDLRGAQSVRFKLGYRSAALRGIPVTGKVFAYLIRSIPIADGAGDSGTPQRGGLPALPDVSAGVHREVITLLSPKRLTP